MFSYFRHCKSCGFGFFKNEFKSVNLFCDSCWLLVEKEKASKNFTIFKNFNLRVKPLYLWKEKDSLVGDLIHGIKGGRPREILEKLVNEICDRNFIEKDLIVVPIPSSKVGEKDHAYILAEMISKKLNANLWNGLRWEYKHKHQKFLSKTERFANTIGISKPLPNCEKIILVDDVVTTGATVIAAHKAIKSLNHVEVWSVACRL